MQTTGAVAELVLMDGLPAARIRCTPGVIPAPGQYVLAHDQDSREPLAPAVFIARLLLDGFMAAPPAPSDWHPGSRLQIRGPLGTGFGLPADARRVALVALENEPRRVLALVDAALGQGASITFVCEDPPYDLPMQIEVQPLGSLADVCGWCDYAAFDVTRESLKHLRNAVGTEALFREGRKAEVLVRTPMPCGGLAACGVCTIQVRRGSRLACVDGPVFDFRLLILEG